jgi:hypothetical protein
MKPALLAVISMFVTSAALFLSYGLITGHRCVLVHVVHCGDGGGDASVTTERLYSLTVLTAAFGSPFCYLVQPT